MFTLRHFLRQKWSLTLSQHLLARFQYRQSDFINKTAAMSSNTSQIHKDGFITRHYDPAIEKLSQTLVLAKNTGASPELIQSLEETFELSRLRDEFALNMTCQESEICSKIKTTTVDHDWLKVYEEKKTTWHLKPGMMSGHLEGQFLKSIISAQKAKTVLDVGMFTGYSALSIAEALPADGKIISLDIDEYLKEFVQNATKDSPHKDKISIIIGSGLESMKKLQKENQSFDAIFLDADKSEYEAYLEICMAGDFLAPNGTIIVDNAFMHGSGYRNAESTSAKFGNLIRNNKDLHVVLVPLRDGIYLIRRRKDVDGGVV